MKHSGLPLIHITVFALLLNLIPTEILAESDSSAAAIADQFDLALKQGDSDAIRAILDDDVLIYEAGNVESSFEEYASHHLSADIQFMSTMEKTILSRKLFENSDLAVVSTEYRIKGSYKGRFIDKTTMETLVLRKSETGWKIVHVHWS